MNSKLLLFDIDGTLVTMWKVHEKAYEFTINKLYGVSGVNFRTHYTPGDSNEEVVCNNLIALGYKKDFIESKIKDVAPTITDYYSLNVSSKDIEILPGVIKLLKSIKKDLYTGIVTGNNTATANTMLSNAGLLEYFSFVIGSDKNNSREKRLLSAIKKAEDITSVRFRHEDVYYFDDSDTSIPISKKLRIKSIAVATGDTPYETLVKAKPDYLLKTMDDTAAILKIISN